MMTDPIADMLTRIRNAAQAQKTECAIPGSKTKRRIAEILKQEGYIDDYTWTDNDKSGQLDVQLRWVNGVNAIEGIKRLSRPGQRSYARSKDIPKVRNGLGIVIVSTSHGMMTDRAARKAGVGGELICSVW